MKSVSEQLRSLSELLRLDFEEQDWGIINANGMRLEEFVDFYDSFALSKEMRYQVFELILASANHALEEEMEDGRKKLVIQDFIRRHGNDFPEQVSYWAGLGSSDEFPLAEVLRNIK